MVDPTLSNLVQTLIAEKRLPDSGANGVLAKYGDGTICRVCQRAVGPSTVMYVLSFGNGHEPSEVTMDYTCFMSWDRERSRHRTQNHAERTQREDRFKGLAQRRDGGFGASARR